MKYEVTHDADHIETVKFATWPEALKHQVDQNCRLSGHKAKKVKQMSAYQKKVNQRHAALLAQQEARPKADPIPHTCLVDGQLGPNAMCGLCACGSDDCRAPAGTECEHRVVKVESKPRCNQCGKFYHRGSVCHDCVDSAI